MDCMYAYAYNNTFIVFAVFAIAIAITGRQGFLSEIRKKEKESGWRFPSG